MSGGDTADGSSFFNDTETGTNKSFVKKVKSRVSGLFPSSLSKWFGTPQDSPKIRHREDLDEDDDTCLLQPPTKRVKLPTVPEPQIASTSRSNLEMTFLSTPLHNEQRPIASAFSTKIMSFSEPQPVAKSTRKLILPSGYNLKNNYNGDLQNGDKDSDSGESTSGYSSMPRIGSKEHVSDDKHGTPNKQLADNISLFNSPAPAERSLFGDNSRMASPNLNTSLSSRRPSFNTSAFGSSNFMDRTLSTKRIVNSPFYSGRTSYGGASAYSRNLLKRPASDLKNFVQPKPIATVKNVTLSKTAKRILDTLEQYTSPSEDVKRIPNPSKRTQKSEGLISKYTGANPYSVRDSKVASNRELQVPTMTDVLKMKLKERLQDSTQSVRELATTSKSPLNVEEYKLLQQEVTDSSVVRNSNKMKTKISSVRPRAEPVEILQDVRLPDVQLPISKLPNFDFNIPLPIKEVKPVSVPKEITVPKPTAMFKTSSTNAVTKTANKQLSKDISVYKFSKPLVISDNLKTIKAINNFKFSKPVCKKSTSQKNDEPTEVAVNFKSSSNNSIPCLRRKVNGENATISAEKELKTTGSVSDVLGRSKSLMDKFKPATGTWECSVCMIRNVQDKTKCAACETPKQSTTAAAAPISNQSGFGSQFKMSSGKWECNSCFVRNDETKTKCVACETPRKSAVAVAANGPKSTIPSSFGDKFKPVASSWECGTCLIRNEQDKVKCVACETPKPGCTVIKADASFGTSFTKKNDEWECSSCMVRNSSDKVKCVCCEAAKPGCTQTLPKSLVNNEQTLPKFNFGIDKAKVDGKGFAFSASNVAPSSVFGDSAKTATVPTTIIFGDNKTPNGTKLKETPQFSFGLPAASAKSSNEPSDVVDANSAKSVNGKLENTTSISTTQAFTFGTKSAEKPAIQIGTVVPTPSIAVESEPSKVLPSKSSTEIKSEGPVIKFGKVESTSSPAATTSSLFNSTVKTSTTTAATPSNMFSFSASNTNSNKVSFGESATKPLSFGQNNTTKPVMFGEKAKPVSFGESSAKPITFGNNSGKPITFGDSTNANPINFGDTVSTKAPPTFGQSLPTKPITFGESTTKPSTFGASTATTTKPSMFGENSVKAASASEDKTKAATFGNAAIPQTLAFGTGTPFAAAAPFSSSASTFGGNNPTNKSTFFGERASNNKATTMFGGPQKATTSTEFKLPTFNAPAFGNSATQAGQSAPPTFGTTAAPSSSTSTFGSSAQSSSTFGAPSQNGGFNFSAPAVPAASNNATNKPSFSFGNAAAGPSTTGTFNFNSNAGASSNPVGGFNFNNPVPNFSSEVKPSFNFTAGAAPSSFTAQPSEGSSQAGKPQRVFRKALRRTQR
ncbi:PREDICTED: nuclear pore complex protein Nup153 [Nicrophorus vespilloides]|uniref:Nuclear pore complex protein Nup153 n=1 Tax=Nicrophorus vespilloides TaxID=110193 RepID=A0ABM1MYZ4_NICVS|nr:PREDICTED: nuclear pore complex protein Nup153 [Nicrophorus vespilloides]